jgi:hypothetical protein
MLKKYSFRMWIRFSVSGFGYGAISYEDNDEIFGVQ